MFYSPGKAGMKWRVCPECPTKWKLRKGSHNKKWKEYYQRVQKPQMDKERELYLMVVKQKEK